MRNHSGPVLCGVVHKDVRRRSCIYTMLLDEILPVNGKTLHSCSFVVPLFEPIYLFLLHRRNSTAKVRTRKIYISLSFFPFLLRFFLLFFLIYLFMFFNRSSFRALSYALLEKNIRVILSNFC